MTKRSLKKLLAGLIGGVLIALAISMFTAASASVSFYYAVTDLGTLGGDTSTAYGINDAGQVVGSSETISGSVGKQHGFLWENGVMSDLGTLGGDTSRGYDINKKGQVTGYAYNSTGEGHGFLWENGVMSDLGTLGGDTSDGYGINDMGQIAGYSTTYSNYYHYRGFLWKNRIMTDIGSLGNKLYDTTQAFDINNEGQVVGNTDSQDGPYNAFHAFRWSDGTMADLGTLGGNYSQADAINKAGDVVGWSEFTKSSTDRHAFLWSNANGTMTDLGTLTGGEGEQSYAYDINNAGRVIGYTTNTVFTWYKGTMTDINTLLPENSGWKITGVKAINNQGKIVGQGSFNGGKSTAVLLTPVLVTN